MRNLSINTDRSSEEWAFLNKGILIKVTESILKFCCRNCLNGKYLHICLFQIFSFYSSECKTLTLTLTLTLTQDDKLWASSENYLYMWDLNDTFRYEFCYRHEIVSNNLNVDLNDDLVSVCDGVQIYFSKTDRDIPIQHIEIIHSYGSFVSKKEKNYFLIYIDEDENENDEQQILLYDIFDVNKQSADVKKIKDIENFIIWVYNLQTNKAYGIDDDDINVLTMDFGNENWKEYFKSVDNNLLIGWNNYLDDNTDFDFDDELSFDTDIESIQKLLKNEKNGDQDEEDEDEDEDEEEEEVEVEEGDKVEEEEEDKKE